MLYFAVFVVVLENRIACMDVLVPVGLHPFFISVCVCDFYCGLCCGLKTLNVITVGQNLKLFFFVFFSFKTQNIKKNMRTQQHHISFKGIKI